MAPKKAADADVEMDYDLMSFAVKRIAQRDPEEP
jgi:hypothetical protein